MPWLSEILGTSEIQPNDANYWYIILEDHSDLFPDYKEVADDFIEAEREYRESSENPLPF